MGLHEVRTDLEITLRSVCAWPIGGVTEFDVSGKVLSLEEKPKHPKSNYAVTGLCFYDQQVVDLAINFKLSLRGELEITDLNRLYLEPGALEVEIMWRGYVWLDTSTHESQYLLRVLKEKVFR